MALAIEAYGEVQPPLSRPALQVAESMVSRLILQDIDKVGGRLVGVGEYGAIIWSDDFGGRWQQAQVPVSVALNAVAMFDDKIGWAVGHGGIVLATRDGGASWQAVFDGVRAAQLVLAQARELAERGELNEQQRLAAERLVEDGPDKPFFDLAVLGPDRLMVVGAFNLAFVTHDGGRSWKAVSDRLPNPMESHLYAIDARAETVFIAGEFGLVMRSFDGGRTFEALELPYEGSLFDLACNGSELVVGGLRGNVFLSRDDGASWEKVNAHPGASITSIEPLADGAFLLTDQSGQLWRLDPAQGAAAYTRLETGALPPATNAVLVDGDQLFVTGMGGTVGPLRLSLPLTRGAEK